MSDRVLTIVVHGEPKPQGSKGIVPTAQGPRTKETSRDLAAWRAAVTQAALDIGRNDIVFDGPTALDVTFFHRMPTSRRASEKRAGIGWRTVSPDTDKLVRAIGDALTASGVIRDDVIFADIHARKVEVTTGPTGARIVIRSLGGLPEIETLVNAASRRTTERDMTWCAYHGRFESNFCEFRSETA